MILRIIDKETLLFIRDDFTFDEETEIGLNVEQAQGFYHPKWNGKKWVEGLSEKEINELKKPQPIEPTLEERLEFIKTQNELALAELAEVILGGML